MKQPTEILSNVEQAILSVLSDPGKPKIDEVVARKNGKEEFIVRASCLPAKRQDRYITFSMGGEEDERLFSADINDLLLFPEKSFGIIMPEWSDIKEISFTKLNDIPKKYASFTGSLDSVWQLDHYLTQTQTLKKDHTQRVFGIKDKKIYVMYPYSLNQAIVVRDRIKHTKECSRIFTLCASVAEDYQLSPYWNIDITDSVTIATYGRIEQVKELLDIRKDPLTQSGQRKRVLHWVASHNRVYGDRVVEVPQHLRGLTEYEIGGFAIKITQPTKESAQ